MKDRSPARFHPGYSRIIIRGLSQESAIALMPEIEMVIPNRLRAGVKLELNHPDPPDLFEDEYLEIDAAMEEIENIDGINNGWGGSRTIKEVNRDVKALMGVYDELLEAQANLLRAIADLKTAASNYSAK